MILSELRTGDVAVLLAVPEVLLPNSLSPGGRISLVLNRPELSVVEAGGTCFALSGELARKIVVVRAPT